MVLQIHLNDFAGRVLPNQLHIRPRQLQSVSFIDQIHGFVAAKHTNAVHGDVGLV